MSCNCSGGCSCGNCQDTALNISGYNDCPGGEPCDMVLATDCSVYKGLEVVDIPVKVGDRLSTIIRRMLLHELYPTCVQPTNPCLSVVDVELISITDTEAEFEWQNPGNTGNTYTPELTLASNISWTQPIPGGISTKVKFINLIPNTSYLFRVKNTDAGATTVCTSLVFKFKTNATI
jgi:hypothetical protein